MVVVVVVAELELVPPVLPVRLRDPADAAEEVVFAWPGFGRSPPVRRMLARLERGACKKVSAGVLVTGQDKAWETKLVQAGFRWDTGAEVARDNVTRLPFHCRLADREHPVLNIWNSSGTR